jgi:hypothetical protein
VLQNQQIALGDYTEKAGVGGSTPSLATIFSITCKRSSRSLGHLVASSGVQKREVLHASLICYHARLVKVKNVSADVSERQALSNLIRCSSSRDPIIKYDSLPTLMSRVDVGASLAGL